MKKEIDKKIWVLKFCLQIVYPKFNYLYFVVFLAIKYRKTYYRRLVGRKGMDVFKINTISTSVQRLLVKEYLEDYDCVLFDKCLLIPRDEFISLASENLFYLDKGVLWVALKLTSNCKKKVSHQMSTHDKFLKYNINVLAPEVNQKFRTNSNQHSLENSRIVPVVGSKHINKDVIKTSEAELHNIRVSFGLTVSFNIEVLFHPVPAFECSPKIASIAEVSIIVNDYDLANNFTKEVLSNYFEVPKLMHTGDIFSIDLTPEIAAKYQYKYVDLVGSEGKLYFKCRKLHNTGNESVKDSYQDVDIPFFIVKGVTQLTLGENIHKLKPKDEFFSWTRGFAQTSLLKSCPTGLKQKFLQIQETITPFVSGDIDALTSSLTSPIIPMLLLTGAIGSGRHLLVKSLAKFNGMNCIQVDCNALQSSTAKQTEGKISSTIQRAKTAAPVIVLMDNFEVFAVDAENNEDCRLIEYFVNSLMDLYQHYTKHTIIFIAVTERSDLKPNILRLFLEKFHISKLDSDQRQEMLQWFASAMQLRVEALQQENTKNVINLNSDTEAFPENANEVLQRVAARTETFICGDIDTLVHLALRESYLQQQNSSNESSPDPNLHIVQEEHFNSALETMRSLQSQHLDAPKIPKVYWEDIGGLDKLKKELLKTIEFPIKYPHLFKNSSLKRSGILLYGPPGCGKTLVAKAVSTELNVSFLSVKGPELLNMYIGQSEENVRKVFESARASSPCIVFLDELDALAPRRGVAGDSGGAADRLVSQLLAELDGVNTQDADRSSFVFVMGATNRPDLLEQSLLRPGRLDKLIYVGPYCGLAEKTKVLTALSRSYNLRPEVQLEQVAAALPDRCTGADLLLVMSTARAAAVRSLVHRIQSGLVKESDLSPDSVIIGVSDLWEGVETFVPSVTEEEMAHYEALQNQIKKGRIKQESGRQQA